MGPCGARTHPPAAALRHQPRRDGGRRHARGCESLGRSQHGRRRVGGEHYRRGHAGGFPPRGDHRPVGKGLPLGRHKATSALRSGGEASADMDEAARAAAVAAVSSTTTKTPPFASPTGFRSWCADVAIWMRLPLRETFAGYPAFLTPGSRKKPDPVALKSISVGNRGVRLIRRLAGAGQAASIIPSHLSEPPQLQLVIKPRISGSLSPDTRCT